MTDHEIIDTFADGERVDPDRLEQALADPSGRAYLVDLLVMRGMVIEQHRGQSTGTIPAPVRTGRPVRLLAIAASLLLLVASGLGGFVAGHRMAANLEVPAPAAVVPERIVLPDTQVSAPAPTRVIQVQPIDWKQSAGGN